MAILNSIEHMYNAITGDSVLGKIGLSAGALAISYFAPITGLLVTCFAFTIIDMIYGIKVAKKHKQKITSNNNWKGTIKKILDEFTIILLARLLEFTVLGQTGVFVLTGGVTVIVALTELWSIIENLNTLNPDGPWKLLSKFLTKKGEQYVGISLEKDLNTNNVNKNGNDTSMAQQS